MSAAVDGLVKCVVNVPPTGPVATATPVAEAGAPLIAMSALKTGLATTAMSAAGNGPVRTAISALKTGSVRTAMSAAEDGPVTRVMSALKTGSHPLNRRAMIAWPRAVMRATAVTSQSASPPWHA